MLTFRGDWHREWEPTSSHFHTGICFYLTSHWQEKNNLLGSFSILFPCFLHSFLFSGLSGAELPRLVPLEWEAANPVLLSQITSLSPYDVSWGWPVSWRCGSDKLGSVWTAHISLHSHLLLPPGPRCDLHHSWEMNYRKKIFLEQNSSYLSITF